MITPWDVIIRIRESVSDVRKKQFYFLVLLSITTAIIEILNLSVLDILIRKILSISDIDKALDSSSFQLLSRIFLLPPKYVLLVLVLFLLLGLVFRLLTLTLQYRYTALIGSDLARGSFYSIIKMPYQWHTAKNSSEAVTILTKDADQFTTFIQECLSFIVNISLVLIVGAWMIQYSFIYFTTITTIFTGVLYAIYRYNKSPLRKDGTMHTLTNQSNIKIVQETLGSIREILIRDSFKIHFDKFSKNYRKYRMSIARITTRVQAPRAIIETFMIIFIALIFVLFFSSKARFIDFTVTGTLLFGILKLLSPLQICFNNLNNLYALQPSVAKIVKAIDSFKKRNKNSNFNSLEETKNLKPFKNFEKISLNNVSFKYDSNETTILRNINLSISRGDRVGIIGITGSGKSTLVDIILGLLKPTKGELIVDGRNLSADNKSRERWMHSLSCVSQNIFLRDASISANIAYGLNSDEIDMDKVKKVAKLACADEFINELPEGYQTRVGERGLMLSGGQRQRLAIASALYSHSKILIFDEATSALDYKTEKKVLEAIQNDEILQTYIFITHRIKTLESCNKIFIVKNGEISEPLNFNEIKNTSFVKELNS